MRLPPFPSRPSELSNQVFNRLLTVRTILLLVRFPNTLAYPNSSPPVDTGSCPTALSRETRSGSSLDAVLLFFDVISFFLMCWIGLQVAHGLAGFAHGFDLHAVDAPSGGMVAVLAWSDQTEPDPMLYIFSPIPLERF